jgi:hydrogenase maturation protein HypF
MSCAKTEEMRERREAAGAATRSRLRVVVRGAVQGVGFRPFVYRLAAASGLEGWVNNSAQGVFVEVEGEPHALGEFLLRLGREAPPLASIQSLEHSYLDPVGYRGFEIRESDAGGAKTALVLPDIATCADCLRDVLDPADRRHLYPFTNCTNCGPRFSIIEALPYDRPNTTMRGFEMCDACRAEYEDPLDRRFHAQPTACPACGPRLELWDAEGRAIARRHDALLAAAEAIRGGSIVALKGLGGFHLVVNARDDAAVKLLRRRKRREEKPFALMFPALAGVGAVCEASELEERLLASPEAPIVLLRRRNRDDCFSRDDGSSPERPFDSQSQNSNLRSEISNLEFQISDRRAAPENEGPRISPLVAPGNPYLGAMLPYTPLHHLLLRELGFPVVATSGNLSDEPICVDEREALSRLEGVADHFLVHDRPIARHVDDSITRVMAGRESVLRRARGYAPLPVPLGQAVPSPSLAVGAHQKNAVAFASGADAFVSQHVGDLDTAQSYEAFARVIESFENLYEMKPERVACDAHPDYRSTRHALAAGLPVLPVQHHYAHVLSCMAENELDAPVLGVAWDGTGYGDDGTVWGGEFLLVTEDGYERASHLRTFHLPGGDRAAREPRRSALGLLYEFFGEDLFTAGFLAPLRAFDEHELSVLRHALRRGVNAPVTSSVGRLFDAAASIVGLRQTARFEGQAAMELEFALEGHATEDFYDFPLARPRGAGADSPPVLDWGPALRSMLRDVTARVHAGLVSARLHNGLAEAVVSVARHASAERVALTGGCFQNKYLTERVVRRLREEGFRPYWHQRVPPNDGGIALGQLAAAARESRREMKRESGKE